MKEATGELNMTVVTVVAIAALIAFFYLVIWPTVKTGMTLSSACNASNGGRSAYTQNLANNGGTISCTGNGVCSYTPAGGGTATTKTCEDSNNK